MTGITRYVSFEFSRPENRKYPVLSRETLESLWRAYEKIDALEPLGDGAEWRNIIVLVNDTGVITKFYINDFNKDDYGVGGKDLTPEQAAALPDQPDSVQARARKFDAYLEARHTEGNLPVMGSAFSTETVEIMVCEHIRSLHREALEKYRELFAPELGKEKKEK